MQTESNVRQGVVNASTAEIAKTVAAAALREYEQNRRVGNRLACQMAVSKASDEPEVVLCIVASLKESALESAIAGVVRRALENIKNS